MAAHTRLVPVLLYFVVLISAFPVFCEEISSEQGLLNDVYLESEEPEERECYGTSVGFSYSGSGRFHFNHLRQRYAGCTHIFGNLEITNLIDPTIDYDLSFLKDIRYVSGYVLLGLITEVKEIPLLNLEIIRGNHTFRLQDEEYSLCVGLTSPTDTEKVGLTELQMPKLKEISNGKVLFTQNPSLGYIDTIDWVPIMRGRFDAVRFVNKAFNQTLSNQTDPSICPYGGMWGDSLDLCQAEIPNPLCDETCDGRCYGPAPNECCHNTCAVGCTGPTERDCLACKDYHYEDMCVGFCPAMSYFKMQNCVKYTE